jgi:hypothetical protein
VASVTIPSSNSSRKVRVCFEKASGGDNSSKSKYVPVERGISTTMMNVKLELELSLFAKKDLFGVGALLIYSGIKCMVCV